MEGFYLTLLALLIGYLAALVICFMKGKLMWGVLGIYLLPVALYGAFRLAKFIIALLGVSGLGGLTAWFAGQGK